MASPHDNKSQAQKPQARKKDTSEQAGSAPARSRIARAGQTLRAEAVRTLARETPPRRPQPAGQAQEPVLPGLTQGLSQTERAALVEISDDADRTLVCMAPETALLQNLRLRLAAVALRTRQHRIILHRRRDLRLEGTGLWDLYTGFIMVGEAREDDAIRLLEANALIGGLRMLHVADRESEKFRLALFVADLPAGVYPAHPTQKLLEVDGDELWGLVKDAPELFSAELLWAEASGALFGKR